MSYVLLALPYLLQLLCIIHVIRSRRESFWIYIILFVPFVGGLAYLLLQILPPLVRGSGRARSPAAVADIVLRTISPSARLRRAGKDAAFSPTHENRRILANEYQACGDYAKALEIHDSLATSTFRLEPELTLQRARCMYATDRFAEGRALIEELERSGYAWRKENEADFLMRSRMTEAAFEVIDRFDAVRRQLDSMRMVYDRPRAHRLASLRSAARQAAERAAADRSVAGGSAAEPAR